MRSPELSEVNEKKNGGRLELALGLFALITIVIAWFVGDALVNEDIMPYLSAVVPEAGEFIPQANGAYEAVRKGGEVQPPLAYVAVGEADGYGGPMTVLTGIDPRGRVIGFTVVNHKETPSYFVRITASDMYKTLAGKFAGDAFQPGEDIDGVTGATWSARALSGAIREAGRKVAAENIGLDLPAEKTIPLNFGLRELAVILLFLSGFLFFNPGLKYNKQIRWVAMIAGLILIGFIYNFPLTIAKINSLLLGYMPDWRYDLFWILLVAGIVISTLVFNRNPYCRGVCPFGAAQECLGAIGGAKSSGNAKQRVIGKWIKRALAWSVIILALIFRSPSAGSYEIFGGLFSLTGSTLQFVLLISVLLASLFIRRPWCNYLCPIDPVVDFLKGTRKLVTGQWKKKVEKNKVPLA